MHAAAMSSVSASTPSLLLLVLYTVCNLLVFLPLRLLGALHDATTTISAGISGSSSTATTTFYNLQAATNTSFEC
jgi:hypothetical protein